MSANRTWFSVEAIVREIESARTKLKACITNEEQTNKKKRKEKKKAFVKVVHGMERIKKKDIS